MNYERQKHDSNKNKSDEQIIEELNERKEDLVKEIDEYNRERDQIKAMLGRIGGEKYSKSDMIINIIFLSAIVVLFIVEVTTQFLPTFVSLEVGILLVSVKIIWMIHSQHKFNHFQFWVLNSIEFRMNSLYSRVKRMEKQVDTLAHRHSDAEAEEEKEAEGSGEPAGSSSRSATSGSDGQSGT